MHIWNNRYELHPLKEVVFMCNTVVELARRNGAV